MHIIKIIAFIHYTQKSKCKDPFEYSKYSKFEFLSVPFLFMNWCMAISMIPKISKVIDKYHSYHIECLDELKSKTIGVVVLYSLSYVFIFWQYLFVPILEKCCECCKNCNHNDKIENNYSYPVKNVYNSSTKNNTNNDNQNNIRTTSRNDINTKREEVEVNVILLFNVLPREVYENLKSFIEQGKEKMIKLISFYLEMRFVGLTTEESISKEIANIVVGVAKILSDIFNDRVAKACLELGTEDHLNLLIHYAFPFIIQVIKLKIEKGIYRRSVDITHVNVIQVLTQVQRRIELDEQGNIKISFRINRQINQESFAGLLNP